MDQFNNNLQLFLQQITKIFPDYKEIIEEKYIFTDSTDKYLLRYYNVFKELGEDLSTKNEVIFSKEFVILKHIDFYYIWNSDKMNDSIKANIWKYLQTLYIYAYEYIKQIDLKTEIKKLKTETENNIDADTRTLLNIIDSLTNKFSKNADGNSDDENDENNEDNDDSGFNFIQPEIFNGKIGSLAKEIAAEINMDEINLENPENLLRDLLSGNFDENNDSSGIMNLVKNITSKIQSKITSGNLDEKELFNEANNVMNSLNKSSGSNDLNGIFSNMMNNGVMEQINSLAGNMNLNNANLNNANLGDIMGNLGNANLGNIMGNLGNMGNLQNTLEKNPINEKHKTKQRLREKLKKKKELLEKKKQELHSELSDIEKNNDIDLDKLAQEIEDINN